MLKRVLVFVALIFAVSLSAQGVIPIGTIPARSSSTPSEGTAASLTHQVTVVLDDDDIKALPPSRFRITGDPADADQVILVQSGVLVTNIIAGAYTATGSEPQLALKSGTMSGGWLTATQMSYAGAATGLTGNFPFVIISTFNPAFTVGTMGDYSGSKYTNEKSLDDHKGVGIFLYDDDNDGGDPYEDGNAANTMRVTLLFFVLDSATGELLTTAETGWDAVTRTFTP